MACIASRYSVSICSFSVIASVVPIEVPPLRERREDIQPLVHHLLSRRGGCHALALPGRWQMKEKPGMRDGSVWLTAIPLSVAPGMPGPNALASTAKQVVFLHDLSLLTTMLGCGGSSHGFRRA